MATYRVISAHACAPCTHSTREHKFPPHLLDELSTRPIRVIARIAFKLPCRAQVRTQNRLGHREMFFVIDFTKTPGPLPLSLLLLATGCAGCAALQA
eukprot:88896-Pleurochrysis_carterae.AAC.2